MTVSARPASRYISIQMKMPLFNCPLCGKHIPKLEYASEYQSRKFPYGMCDAAANADHLLLDDIIFPLSSYSGYKIDAGDALHSRCLAAWPQKAAFLAHWNRALAEEWPGKALLDNGAEGFAYTPQEQWSASALRLQEEAKYLEEQKQKSAVRKIKLDQLEIKKEQGRALIIAAGLCSPETVDAYIYDMDIKDFRLHLAGTGLSRVDFRPDQ